MTTAIRIAGVSVAAVLAWQSPSFGTTHHIVKQILTKKLVIPKPMQNLDVGGLPKFPGNLTPPVPRPRADPAIDPDIAATHYPKIPQAPVNTGRLLADPPKLNAPQPTPVALPRVSTDGPQVPFKPISAPPERVPDFTGLPQAARRLPATPGNNPMGKLPASPDDIPDLPVNYGRLPNAQPIATPAAKVNPVNALANRVGVDPAASSGRNLANRSEVIQAPTPRVAVAAAQRLPPPAALMDPPPTIAPATLKRGMGTGAKVALVAGGTLAIAGLVGGVAVGLAVAVEQISGEELPDSDDPGLNRFVDTITGPAP